MALTFSSFITTLGSLSVSGVTGYTAPPHRINATELPIGYPRIFNGEPQNIITCSTPLSPDTITCEYVIVVNPVLLSRNAQNYTAAATAADNLATALKTESDTDKEIYNYNIRLEIEDIGDTPYWLVVAEVFARA